jgi:hypothetical protein
MHFTASVYSKMHFSSCNLRRTLFHPKVRTDSPELLLEKEKLYKQMKDAGREIDFKDYNNQKQFLINHIIIDQETTGFTSPSQFIENDFDYDFVKVWFDGKELKIHDFDSVMKKRSKLCYHELMYRSHSENDYSVLSARKRIKKYLERGFDIPNLSNDTIERLYSSGSCEDEQMIKRIDISEFRKSINKTS